MIVVKNERPDGTLIGLEFRAEGETLADFKVAIKTWWAANYPSAGYEQFFDNLKIFEDRRVIMDV